MRHGFRAGTVLVVVAVLVVGLTAAAAGATRPPAVTCGQTITSSVVLRADLSCSGDGLVIAASNVTVWLAGHTITSTDGTGVGIRFGVAPTATDPAVSVHDVAIRSGTVSGFDHGIAGASGNGTGNVVSGLNLQGNTWGIYLEGGRPIAVDHTTIVGPNGIGGLFAPAAQAGGVQLSHSRVRVTSPGGFSVLSTGVPSSIDSSRLDSGIAYGISNGNLDFTDSTLTGVTVQCSDAGLSLVDTRVVGGGIVLGTACGTHLEDDRFIGSGSGVAVQLGATGFSTTVIGSQFSGWDTGIALALGTTTITGNTFRDNGTGIASCSRSDCTGTISGNSFLGNSGTGLLLTAGSWHVGSNLAVRNGGLGIDAQGPQLTVTDDGGNVARRNLAPQCVGVVCTAHS